MIQQAVNAILQDQCVVFPTETVYGLGANALSESAVQNIFRLKNRPSNNPLIVHIAGLNQLSQVTEKITPLELKLFETFSPGPLSLVLPKKNTIPNIVTGSLDSVGVRIPNHPLALEFLQAVQLPICAPSANISGKPSPSTYEMASYYMKDKALILDGGDLEIGIESTVIKVIDQQIYILRPGMITPEMIADTTGIIPIYKFGESHKESPGTQYAHYQPKAEVILVDHEFRDFKENSALLSIHKIQHPNIVLNKQFNSCMEYAHNLYASFFECDQKNITYIYCELPLNQNEGLALNDRLSRASQK